LSDPYDFESIFEEMVRLTERLFGGQDAGPAVVRRMEREEAERDELIERADSFEYILTAPGYQQRELLVSVQDRGVEVKTPDFIARKEFPSRVDPDTAASHYRNGVLSVTVKKS